MIRIRYTPKQGPPVNSEMINVVLPGVKKKNVEGAAGEANPPAVTEEVRTPRNSHPGPAVGQKIPTPQEIQDMIARRPRAVDLDERERQRIIREARQRLAAEGRDEVSLADWDTAEQGGNMPNATSASQNRGRVRHQAGALSSESASPDGERPTVPEAGWLGDPNAGERRDPHPEEESDF